jgi:hypothetical protein
MVATPATVPIGIAIFSVRWGLSIEERVVVKVGLLVVVEINGFLSADPGQGAGHCKRQLLLSEEKAEHVQPPLSQLHSSSFSQGLPLGQT